MPRLKELFNDIRGINIKYKCVPLIIFAVIYIASPIDLLPELFYKSWLFYLDDIAVLILTCIITYMEVFSNERNYKDNERIEGVYSAVRRNTVERVAGGILTALVVLAAMLFMAYQLIHSLRSNLPRQTTSQVKRSYSPNPSSSISEQPIANNRTVTPENVSLNNRSSQMSQQQTTVFGKYQNNPDPSPLSSTTETQSFGNMQVLKPGAFEQPNSMNNQG